MYYIYLIVNKVNGKTYVGQRESSKQWYEDKYMGSGKERKTLETHRWKTSLLLKLLKQKRKIKINNDNLHLFRFEKN